ncbi:MAG: hypothetical protein NBV67_11955 [Tagaea sp.]|nr:hypothetical protein [Tagaea sp.]
MTEHFKHLWTFFWHIVVGAALFALIAFAAVLLKSFTSWLSAAFGPPELIVDILNLVGYIMFGVDVVSFLAYLFVATRLLLRGLFS